MNVPRFLSLTVFSTAFAIGSAASGQGNEAADAKLVIEFADKAKAVELLQTEDDFTAGLSKFDLQVRLKTESDVTLDDLKKRIGISTLDWTDEERDNVNRVLETIRPRLEAFRLPFPKVVHLVKTNGKEDADAAYTRGTTIVFPEKTLRGRMERLMLHELFHVLSRNSREFREHMYAVIGFKLCDDIPLPQSLVKRKISNPDAPRMDCYLTIRQGKDTFDVTPVLYSRNDYDARRDTNLFSSMEFKLMRLIKTDKGYRPAEASGQLLLDPADVADFHAQIGANTKYIIHPDEVLADNFVHLVMGDENLKSMEIVEGMKNVVRRAE